MKTEAAVVSLRAGLFCLAVAGLAVGLGGAAGAGLMVLERPLARLSLSTVTAVGWNLTSAWLSTTLSILPKAGQVRAWFAPLALGVAMGELVPRSAISLPLLIVSLLALGVVAVAAKPQWRRARTGAALVCGASIAAMLVTSNG